ncbi:MAG: helix-turn-helix domain-containing protein [Microbacteriaceae bacterium]
MLIRDGFPGQRLRVLPRPLIAGALRNGPTARLLVTDVGHFPHAAQHGRIRPRGAEQAIVILCIAGAGWARVDGLELTVQAGQALLLPSQLPHAYGADVSDPWTIWWLHAAGDDVGSLVEAVVGDDARYVISMRDPYRAVGLAEHASECLERDETASSLIGASGAAWNLLAQLAADRQRGQRGMSDRILLAQDYLREHLAASTTVPELARLAGMSVSHFSALFKASAGIGVVEYVKRLRSARARELLLTTDRGVAEIAAEVGYEDAFYFSRQFRTVNGVSPRQFRERSHHEYL